MAAPLFSANVHRHDPYRTFKFQIPINGQPVAGFRKMSALKKSTEAVDWRTGGDPTHVRKLPGGTSYEAITLEQGLTHDLYVVKPTWTDCVLI
jgi:phage tail-like protein